MEAVFSICTRIRTTGSQWHHRWTLHERLFGSAHGWVVIADAIYTHTIWKQEHTTEGSGSAKRFNGFKGIEYHDNAFYLTADDGDAEKREPDHIYRVSWMEKSLYSAP